MTRRIKQYKPIKFGDGPDPDSVEGRQNKMAEAAETRAYNRRMKELAAEDELRREGLLSKVFGFFFSRSGDIDPCAAQLELADRWDEQVLQIGETVSDEKDNASPHRGRHPNLSGASCEVTDSGRLLKSTTMNS
jgi:hypothetical protein